MIDSHCHVLFGIDDGPTTLEDSITMLRDAAKDGVNKVICTSHCVPGIKFENEYSILKPVYDQVVEELKRQKIDLKLYLGCELMVTPLSLEWLKENRIATINQTQWLLVEIPYLSNLQFDLDVEETFRTLISMGYKVLIAHPERYKQIQNDYSKMAVWRSIGCYFSVNRTSLLDTAREVDRNLSWKFIEDNYCDVIATDAHRTSIRNITLSDAYAMVETRFGSDRAQRLFIDNPQRLIDGRDLL